MLVEHEQTRARTRCRRPTLARQSGLLLFLVLIAAACGSSGSEQALGTSNNEVTAEETEGESDGIEQVEFEIPVADSETQAQAGELLSDPAIAAAIDGAAQFDPTATDELDRCIAEQSIVQDVNLEALEELVANDIAAAEAIGLEVAFLGFQCSPEGLVQLLEADLGQVEGVTEEQFRCTVGVFTEMIVSLSVSAGTEFMFSGAPTPMEWIDSTVSRCGVSVADAVFILG